MPAIKAKSRPAAKKKSATPVPPPAARGLSRPVVVGVSLLAALGLTAGLLRWASPSPLAPDAVGRLFATSDATAGDFFAAVFDTAVAVKSGRWRTIYVHQSKTGGGDAATLADAAADRGVTGPADHFVIGNGLGAGDGEVQFTPRWDEQRSAAAPTADTSIDAACVSICLVGDLDRARPTEAQLRRLDGLIAALCRRLNLSPRDVRLIRDSPTAAGIGARYAAAR